jgi:predicted phosphodiesterase
MATKSKARTICEKALSRYSDKPILTIAKKIYEDNPILFKDIESVRTMLRSISGSAGAKTRKKKTELTRPLSYKYAPFESIPQSYAEPREPFVMPKACNKILILNDIHFPFHSEEALRVAINYGVEQNVNCVLLNGDVLDVYQLSDHMKDPSKPRMREELEMGRWFMAELRKTFPHCPIYYKIGNHEMRIERWLKIKAFEWIDCDEFQLKILLEFGRHGIQQIDKFTTIKAGNLRIIHGHEYKGGGGVNPGRYMYLKAKTNVLCGHFHRSSSHIDKNLDGEYRGGWSVGCLCDLSPDYLPNNDWVHGFAVVSIDNSGHFEVDNKIIINGKIK